MFDKIEIYRNYPYQKNKIILAERYDKNLLNEFQELQNNNDYKQKHNILINGINFETNRKIKKDANTYKKLYSKYFEKKFKVKNGMSYEIKYDDFINLNVEEYKNETHKLKIENEIENKNIEKYNEQINNIIEKIEKLTDWNDYIIFENKKFGLKNWYKNIHYENNCKGKYIVKKIHESCECNLCENWNGCGGSGYTIYKLTCLKCLKKANFQNFSYFLNIVDDRYTENLKMGKEDNDVLIKNDFKLHSEENCIINLNKPIFKDKHIEIHGYYIKNNEYIYVGINKYTLLPTSYTLKCKWDFIMDNEYYNRGTDLFHYKDGKGNDIMPYHISSLRINKIYNEYNNIFNEKILMQKEDKDVLVEKELVSIPSKNYIDPWIYLNIKKNIKMTNTGKWMLFYERYEIDEKWNLIKYLYNNNKLQDVLSLKCSTIFKNSYYNKEFNETHVIIIYCNNSEDEENILNIGKKILEFTNYNNEKFYNKYIYYKTDEMTRKKIKHNGNNYLYKI